MKSHVAVPFGAAATLCALAIIPGAPALAQGYNSMCVAIVGEWCGANTIGDCFQYSGYWQALPEECLADVESMIEDENDFFRSGGDGMADGNYDPGVANGQGYLIDAYSWGGNLRTGPGGSYRSIAVLQEGEPLQVLAATDSYFQGYPWFLVYSFSYGEGYQWGGIICTRGDWAEGISGYC